MFGKLGTHDHLALVLTSLSWCHPFKRQRVNLHWWILELKSQFIMWPGFHCCLAILFNSRTSQLPFFTLGPLPRLGSFTVLVGSNSTWLLPRLLLRPSASFLLPSPLCWPSPPGGRATPPAWSALRLFLIRVSTAAVAAAAAPGPVRTFRSGKVFCRRIAAITSSFYCTKVRNQQRRNNFDLFPWQIYFLKGQFCRKKITQWYSFRLCNRIHLNYAMVFLTCYSSKITWKG